MTSRNRRQRRWKREQQLRKKISRYENVEFTLHEIHYHQVLQKLKAQEWIYQRQKMGMEYVV